MTIRAFPTSSRYSSRFPNNSIARFPLSIAPFQVTGVHPRGSKRRGCERGVDPVVLVDRDTERLAQQRDGLFGASRDGVKLAEVVQQLAHVLVVGHALEQGARPLCVLAGEGVLVPPLRNE